jgi:hypothetical protein
MATSWDDFLSLHSGPALPYADVVGLYKALQPPPSPPRNAARKSGFNQVSCSHEASESVCVAPMPLAWSEFQRVYGGDAGLSQRELLALYERQKRAWTPIAVYPPPAPPVHSTTKTQPVESKTPSPSPSPPAQNLTTVASVVEEIDMESRRANDVRARGGTRWRGRGGRPFGGERRAPSQAPPPTPQVQAAPSTPQVVGTPSPHVAQPQPFWTMGFGRPNPETEPTQERLRSLLASRAFKTIPDSDVFDPKECLRVKDFNGSDVSYEEIANQFKSLSSMVQRGRGLEVQNTAMPSTFSANTVDVKKGIMFQDTSETGRMFFDVRGLELSQEEVRAAQYEFRVAKPKVTPFTAPQKSPTRDLVNVVSPSSISARVPPSRFGPNEAKRVAKYLPSTEQLPRFEAKLVATYPPSTEHLPRVSFPFARQSHFDQGEKLLIASPTFPPATQRAPHRKPFAAYPPSTELLPRAPSPFTTTSQHARFVRPTQRFVHWKLVKRTNASPTKPPFAAYPPSTEPPVKKTNVSPTKAPFAAYPPSTESLPWVDSQEDNPLRSHKVLDSFGSLGLAMASPKSSLEMMLVDPEMLLFPLISSLQQEAEGPCDKKSSVNEEQDDTEPSIDTLINEGQKLLVALSRTYEFPCNVAALDSTAPEEAPELEGAAHDAFVSTSTTEASKDAPAMHDCPTADPDPPALASEMRGPRFLKLIPSGQYLKLSPDVNASTELLGTCVSGELDPGKRVAVSILDAPHESVETEFNTVVGALARATGANARTTRIYGAVSLSEKKQVGIVREQLDGWYPLAHTDQSSETRKLQVLIQVAVAVAKIHSDNVAHGDLKPAHVLVQDNGINIKLDRVGWSRLQTLVASTQYATMSGTFPECFLHCTPAYAAPEVLQGTLSKSDLQGWMKSDIYSLTVIAAEVLLGRRPWEGETPMYIWNAVTRREDRPFNFGDIRIAGKTSHALELLLRRGWHQDPAHRPSAFELAQGLSALQLSIDS